MFIETTAIQSVQPPPTPLLPETSIPIYQRTAAVSKQKSTALTAQAAFNNSPLPYKKPSNTEYWIDPQLKTLLWLNLPCLFPKELKLSPSSEEKNQRPRAFPCYSRTRIKLHTK